MPRTKTTGRPYVFAQSTVATARRDGLHVHIFEGDVWDATDPIASKDRTFSPTRRHGCVERPPTRPRSRPSEILVAGIRR
jgi:hypothetical protein